MWFTVLYDRTSVLHTWIYFLSTRTKIFPGQDTNILHISVVYALDHNSDSIVDDVSHYALDNGITVVQYLLVFNDTLYGSVTLTRHNWEKSHELAVFVAVSPYQRREPQPMHP